MKRILTTLLGILILVFAYLLFWPTEVAPNHWKAPLNPGYTGQFATNTKLTKVDVRHLNCTACEDVAIDSIGAVYGAAVDGRILKFQANEDTPTALVNTGGRPLGLDFDTTGNLYIADANKGLLRYTTNGKLEVLSTQHNDRPYLFTDDLEVSPDGRVYFTDASDHWSIHEYKFDLLEHRPAGRLLVYDPRTKQVDLLMDSLYFANGVAVAADTSFVLVNETSSYRTLKYWLKGDKEGQWEVFIDNLPAFPDGISRGSNGIFWLAMISPRNPIIDQLSDQPFLRKAIARLPDWAQPAPEVHAGILGINAAG
ncbi:MAG: SMP-30/gluconolactonase/LRE family protein, partial [Bacteroidota bacterium]